MDGSLCDNSAVCKLVFIALSHTYYIFKMKFIFLILTNIQKLICGIPSKEGWTTIILFATKLYGHDLLTTYFYIYFKLKMVQY